MTTNRTRRTRGRIGADGLTNDAYIFYKWGGTFQNSFSHGKSKDEIMAFWEKYRDVIMQRYFDEAKRRGPGWASRRPSFYFNELEAKHPRRITGKNEWIGPMRPDGGDRTIIDDVYESNFQYLKRLGLLEAWELEHLETTATNG